MLVGVQQMTVKNITQLQGRVDSVEEACGEWCWWCCRALENHELLELNQYNFILSYAEVGQASCKKLYGNIFVSNGVSLHGNASPLQLICGHLSKKNDELSGMCCKGGKLLLYDGCPRSFRKDLQQ
ncbi:hypothetical protein L1887_38362 [Cichorium endivia]|nr:hypothetical protein L1887_38362 [Cichorium endivia]